MTKKITITSDQENCLRDLFRECLRKLRFTKDEAQEIINLGEIMQRRFKPILRGLAVVPFGQAIKNFNFTVPADYKHDSQLDTFAKKTKNLETTAYFDDALTSANFAKATNKLEPGKTYKVKIFPIQKKVTSEDCLSFYRKQNALFVGGQGLTILQENKADKFPVGENTGYSIVSFDVKNALWTDSDGCRRVPEVVRHHPDPDGRWEFSLGYFKYEWDEDYCLLCFCDL